MGEMAACNVVRSHLYQITDVFQYIPKYKNIRWGIIFGNALYKVIIDMVKVSLVLLPRRIAKQKTENI